MTLAAIMNLQTLKNLLIIRRMEFYIVELTIFGMPLLVTAAGFRELLTFPVLEGFVMFFILYALGDMINCLADRELDSTYKTRLSRAVYGLGVDVVRKLVIAEIIASLIIAIHLSWFTGRWLILGLVLVGMFLGIGYSIGPFHFKARGIWHLICLWLLLYFLPMLCSSLLLRDYIPWQIVLLAASYATVEMGIILINTSEDLPEDRVLGIRTTTVALGLNRTLWLAFAMVLVGGLAFTGFWLEFYLRIAPPAWGYVTLAGLFIVCFLIAYQLLKLSLRVNRASNQTDAIMMVKARGSWVPVWATMVGWLGVLCGALPLILGSG